jgi:ribonuclease E
MYSSDVNRIVTDTQAGVKRVKQHLMSWSGGRAPEGVVIDNHREPENILDYFRVNAAIREALKPRVDLPSGGYVIIEPTEALTVIDVNSGSFTRSATARETVLWTNSEAATEIARQLRLRNIGGVIIVDFIDMDSRRDQLKLLEHFNRSLKFDKARPQIAQLSELGLVELTRKRQGQNIYELFGRPCPTCGGLGHLAELPGEVESICLESPVLSLPSTAPRIIEKPFVETTDPTFESSFDYEGTESASAFDLLYHPNYQEQGGNQANRRRRRRPRPDGKEESPGKVLPNLIPKIVDLDIEPEVEGRKERREVAGTTRELGGVGSSSRISRREEIPTERVSVELTPLEQDVYALMGVSPLIRLDQEFKDPKAVIVAVKTKGDSSVPDAESKAIPEPTLETSLPKADNDIIKLKPEILTLGRRQRSTSITSEPDFSSSLSVMADPKTETEEPGIPFKEPMFKEEIEPPIVRRRKRRSSAQEDDW